MKPATKNPVRTAPTPGVLPPDLELTELLASTTTESGRNLLELVDEKPALFVFLRHFGDAFTRETIHDVSKAAAALDKRGVRVIFIHMAAPERARPFFERYGLGTVERVSDPTMRLYTAPVFHLLKSTVLPHFFGARAYWKLAKRALWRYGVGSAGKEDPTQLPGVFFIKARAIHRAFRHRYLGDRPDYDLFGV